MKLPKEFKSIFFLLFFAIAFIFINYNYADSFNINKLLRTNRSTNGEGKNESTVMRSRTIPILMYHYIQDVEDRNSQRYNLATRPSVLENQIITLKDAGYIFITPSEFNEAFADADNKYVVLSFDDGYEDFYINVYPILRKYNVKAINYIMPNFIGNDEYLNDNQIRELIRSNSVEFGSHTINHTSLTSVDLETINYEVTQSKLELESAYNITIDSFAYPYGRYNNEILEVVKNAGYTNAVTTDEGNEVSDNNIFEIPRIRPGINVGQDLLNQIENY